MQAAVDEGFDLVVEPPAAPAPAPAVARWARLLVRAERLAFKRRCFGHLGSWLRQIRERGRLLDDGAARRRA